MIAFIVLGMHRSGTSTISGILSILGLSLGETPSWPNKSNPKGFFENYTMNVYNDAIFKKLSVSWDTTYLLKKDWFNRDNLRNDFQNLEELLSREFNESQEILIKDPRICILLPIYLEVMKRNAIKPRFIISFRHPFEVSASLRNRDGFTSEKSLKLWTHHMLSAELYSRAFPRIFINYQSVLSDPLYAMQQIVDSFNISLSITKDVNEKVISFVEPGLKHFWFEKENNKNVILNESTEIFSILNKYNFNDIESNELIILNKIRRSTGLFHE